MRFNPKARLDTSRVGDAGSSGAGSGGLGGGIRIPGGKAGGGGIVAIIIAVVVFFLQQGGGGSLGGLGGALNPSRFTGEGGGTSQRYADCKTGEDANRSVDCARVAVENSLTDFWSGTLEGFQPISAIVTFKGGVQTNGCGGASSAVGPFYCPADTTIYLDDAFFDDVLVGQLNGPKGAFVEPYVLAHEYGHHISNLIGSMRNVGNDTGPQSGSVRLELQADCFAGLWAQHASQTEDETGEVLLLELSQDDIDTALEAAKTVGDDYIQQQSGGGVNQDGWTHGSSEQRQRWFMTGFQGSFDDCDTFGAGRV